MTDEQIQALLGWNGIDAVQQQLVQGVPDFSDIAGDLYYGSRGDDQFYLLYKAMYEVWGTQDTPYVAQEIGDCLGAGSMVLGETIKPIEDVKIGDIVWTGEGMRSRVVSTRAIETMKPMVRVHALGSLPITCTEDHEFLVYRSCRIGGKKVTKPCYERYVNGSYTSPVLVAAYEAMAPEWVKAGNLSKDDYILSPARLDRAGIPDDALLNRIWGIPGGRRMLGYFVGDGSASGGSVEFALSSKEITDALSATLCAIGFKPIVKLYRKGCNAWRIRVHSGEFSRFCDRHFYSDSGSKVFPGWAIGDEEFIAGLHEADGHDREVSGRVEHAIDSTSPGVVNGVVASLRCIGFNPCVRESVRSKGSYANAKPIYRIRWAEQRERMHLWRDEHFVCHPVRKVEFIEGPSLVYDIGVEDSHHSFVANGVVVHNCVSHGFSHANDCRQCIEIVLDGSGEFRETDTEFMYGASREVAHILGPQDGSYGAAVVKAATEIGMVSREMLGSDGKYSGARAKAWGRTGPPAKYKAMAADYKLGSYAAVKNFDDALAALKNGYPILECCGIFGQGERDQDGFIEKFGRGGHCQAILAARLDKPGLMVFNSWPPSAYSGPKPMDMPQQGYWITQRQANAWLAEGDSYALSSTPYFKKRDIPKSWKLDGAAFPTL